MPLLLGLALAVTPQTPDPHISAWAACVGAYAKPRLRTQSTEAIVNGGLAACAPKQETVRRAYIRAMGPETGASSFVSLKHGVRQIMLRRVAQAKQQRGYR